MVISGDKRALGAITGQLRDARDSIVVVGPFPSALGALERLGKLAPDVVVVAEPIRAIGVRSLVGRIKAQRPNAAILWIGSRREAVCRQAVIPAGNCSFLAKPLRPGDLVDAIRCAADGLLVLSPCIAEAFREEQGRTRARLISERRLNQRELGALDLLSRFLANKNIAEELGVSCPLGEKILRNVYRKLGVRTRSEAIVLWRLGSRSSSDTRPCL